MEKMEKQIMEIAQRIKGLREIEDITIEEMAEYTGKSVEEYAEYEAGNKEFSFSFLFTVANKFGIDITELLTGEGAKLSVYTKVKYGQGLAMERRKAYKYMHLAPIFKNRKMEPFLVTVEPSAHTDSAVVKHAHDGHEINYVTKGQMTFYIDDNEVELEEGDMIYFDASHAHAMKAENNTMCQFLAIISK